MDPLFDIPGGWRDCELDIAGVRLRLTIPADPDQLLDAHVAAIECAEVQAQAERPDPYWAALWSAARPTAEAVVRARWPAGATALELGCGVGLVGLAALARGLHVTFSDHTPQAIRIALENARRNGYTDARSQVIDWHSPPRASFDIILASDVLYQRENHASLVYAIERLLAPHGVCWIGDPGRCIVSDFLLTASRSFDIHIRDQSARPCTQPTVGQFQLLELRRDARRPCASWQ